MRVLVSGAAGMLGLAFLQAARATKDMQVTAAVRRAGQAEELERQNFAVRLCDIACEADVEKTLKDGYDAMVNCAGVTKKLAADPVATIRINSLAPHLLARSCAENGTRLIHISTDCVFSGKHGNYAEEDAPDPQDLYGQSKWLGEVAYGDHLTVRTSFIGREMETKNGLVEWFLTQKGRLDGYTQAFWSGLTAAALSRILLELCRRREIIGILNVGGQRIDKFSLLELLKLAYKKNDVEIRPVAQPHIDRSLDSNQLRKLGLQTPALQEMIEELAAENRLTVAPT